MKKHFAFLILFGLVLFDGCKEEAPYVVTCVDGPIQWESLTPFSFQLQNVGDDPNGAGNTRKPLSLIINSDEQYMKFMRSSGAYSPVDFKRQTMLLVRTNKYLAYDTTQSVTINCETNIVSWVKDAHRFTTGGPPDPFNNIYIILVPKLSYKASLIFKENIK